jgi:predicted DNA-binding ribbon-helix-helix protein
MKLSQKEREELCRVMESLPDGHPEKTNIRSALHVLSKPGLRRRSREEEMAKAVALRNLRLG